MSKRLSKRNPLPRCTNGCSAPTCPPSLCLCRACLDALDEKIREMLTAPASERKEGGKA